MRILLALTASGSVLIALLLLLKALLGKRLSSTVYYYLWLLVMLRFVLPAPGIVPIEGKTETAPVRVMNTAMTDRPGVPEVQEAGNDGRNYEEFWLSTMAQEADAPAESTAENAGRAISIDWKNPALWLSIWAAGALGSLGFYGFSYFHFRARMRKALLPARESDLAVSKASAPRGLPSGDAEGCGHRSSVGCCARC